MPSNEILFRPSQLKVLPTFFIKTSYFQRAANNLQVDGITFADNAFSVKYSNIFINLDGTKYDTTVKLGGGKSRFGTPEELTFLDKNVPFSWTAAKDLRVDKFTVNAEMAHALSEAQSKLALAEVRLVDKKIATELVAQAGASLPLATVDSDNVEKAFTKARQTMSNNAVITQTRHAYVTPDILDFLSAHNMLTNAKGQAIHLSEAEPIARYKGFDLIEVPEEFMPTGIKVILTVDNVTNPFIGIEEARILQVVEGHTGSAIQYASKGGIYTQPDSKKAIITIAG